MNPEQLAQAYRNACIAELEAVKPGNVHLFSDGHGMVINDFIKSADASASIIAKPSLSVGERVLQSVQATQASVGMNTNLGIILLCAPLIHTALNSKQENDLSFQQKVGRTLSQLTVDDAVLVAEAIVLANPAGLGASNMNDVHNRPNVSLYEMMATAQDKDRIAWQYVNQFADIFEFGLVTYGRAVAKWQNLTNNRGQNRAWATTALYLGFLARQLDSHVVRKYGEPLAKALMLEALEMETVFCKTENPKLVQKQLLAWDASLKERKINPGTSADLTVACLLLNNFEEII